MLNSDALTFGCSSIPFESALLLRVWCSFMSRLSVSLCGHLCHTLPIKASEARLGDKLNVTQMGAVGPLFDASGAAEGQTPTNTCQTKLLDITKDSFTVPLDPCRGEGGWRSSSHFQLDLRRTAAVGRVGPSLALNKVSGFNKTRDSDTMHRCFEILLRLGLKFWINHLGQCESLSLNLSG